MRKNDNIENIILKDGWTVRISPDELMVNSIVDIEYKNGAGNEVYFIPLLLTRNNECGDGSFISKVKFDGTEALVCEPLGLKTYFENFMNSLYGGLKFETLRGGGNYVEFRKTPRTQRRAISGIKQFSGELSNSIAFIDRTEVVKIYRRLSAGVNPDLEVHIKLGELGGSPAPPFLGYVVYVSGGSEYVLSMIEGFVESSGDAWQYFLQKLEDRQTDYLAKEASLLGETVAKLHYDLFRAFGADEFGRDDASLWETRLRDSIARSAGYLPEMKVELEDCVPVIGKIRDYGRKIRIHGDLHLGQILKTPSGYCVIDFEGEPLKSSEENRKKNSPLKDIAGALRSFNYAANYFAKTHADTGASFAFEWERRAAGLFLASYFETVKKLGCDFLPADNRVVEEMLALYKLEKALYELEYEIKSRPAWIDVPLNGIKSALKDLRDLSLQ